MFLSRRSQGPYTSTASLSLPFFSTTTMMTADATAVFTAIVLGRWQSMYVYHTVELFKRRGSHSKNIPVYVLHIRISCIM